MEFWGVEVKKGEKVVVPPKDDMMLRLTQACLGEVKKDKANLSVYLNMLVGDQKFVIGTLSAEKFPQLTFDLSIEKEFVLSHSWKNGSVHFCGYRAPSPLGELSDTSSDSDSDINLGEHLPQNGKSMLQAKGNQPSSSRTNAMKPDSDTSDDSDEFESDDDETLPAEAKIENAKDDESEEGVEDTPKKVVPSKKRKAGSPSKSPLPDKKAKLVTPQKSDGGKKNVVHVDTPYPKQVGKTSNIEKSKQQATNSTTSFKCTPCNRTFTSDVGLESHTKAKHSAT